MFLLKKSVNFDISTNTEQSLSTFDIGDTQVALGE